MDEHMVSLEAALDAVTDERDAALACLVAAQEERDAARRVLLALADGCDAADPDSPESRNAILAFGPVDRALGLDDASWADVAAAIRRVCGSAESTLPRATLPRVIKRDCVTLRVPTVSASVVAITAERDALRRIGVQVADMIDRGYTPGHALARCLGLSLALTDREMAGALRGLCGVRRG